MDRDHGVKLHCWVSVSVGVDVGIGSFNDEHHPEEIFAIYLPESAQLQGVSAGWEHCAAW